MINLIDLEKKINSELATKIKKTQINHDQIYLEIDKEDLIDVTLFKYRQWRLNWCFFIYKKQQGY